MGWEDQAIDQLDKLREAVTADEVNWLAVFEGEYKQIRDEAYRRYPTLPSLEQKKSVTHPVVLTLISDLSRALNVVAGTHVYRGYNIAADLLTNGTWVAGGLLEANRLGGPSFVQFAGTRREVLQKSQAEADQELLKARK